MADDTRLPLGTEDGDTYASDEIGGVKFQRIKLIHGVDGVNDGDVASANPLPVTANLSILSGSATAATVGTAGATIATITNAGYKRLKFAFDVVTQNITSITVHAKGHGSSVLIPVTPTSWASLPSGSYILHTSVNTTSTGVFVDGDINTVDAAQSGFFDMEVDGFTEIQVKGVGAVNSASVTPRWTLTR